MPSFERHHYVTGLVLLLLFAFLGGVYYGKNVGVSTNTDEVAELKQMTGVTDKNSEVPEYIEVFVAGAVEEARICRLPYGSRVYKAVEMARALPDANLAEVDMARVLEDGETILVHSLNPETEKQIFGEERAVTQSGKVNINKATPEEMAAILPGIGPTLGKRIVEYREVHGKFKTPEDICKVTGIGSKKYEAICDFITVK